MKRVFIHVTLEPLSNGCNVTIKRHMEGKVTAEMTVRLKSVQSALNLAAWNAAGTVHAFTVDFPIGRGLRSCSSMSFDCGGPPFKPVRLGIIAKQVRDWEGYTLPRRRAL